MTNFRLWTAAFDFLCVKFRSVVSWVTVLVQLYPLRYRVTYHFLANVRSTVNFWHKNQNFHQNSNRSLFGRRRGVRHEGSLPIRHGCPRVNLVVGNTFSIWRYFDGCARNVLLPQRRISKLAALILTTAVAADWQMKNSRSRLFSSDSLSKISYRHWCPSISTVVLCTGTVLLWS